MKLEIRTERLIVELSVKCLLIGSVWSLADGFSRRKDLDLIGQVLSVELLDLPEVDRIVLFSGVHEVCLVVVVLRYIQTYW